ncbi:hypothetical protein PsorP6_003242 [Peronosclerospora sorghi]|uniref:Uncharacterized protein n=1 Tax=Peronosclerospora sorghi TaxID=230839 RepID=A0ACC0VQ79_9STRA|nr:hypothetical protein PsorP6_003242 [Peronosclerospora sorghi]
MLSSRGNLAIPCARPVLNASHLLLLGMTKHAATTTEEEAATDSAAATCERRTKRQQSVSEPLGESSSSTWYEGES